MAADPAPTAPSLSNELAGALCYLVAIISGVLFLLLAPYNRNREVRFHAFQSIFLSIAWILVWSIWAALSTISGELSLVGGLLAGSVAVMLGWGFVILWLLLVLQTYRGQKMVLPIIGPLAEKQAA
jgi:uncharacterized membrane protein